jgi:hypothetical protein
MAGSYPGGKVMTTRVTRRRKLLRICDLDANLLDTRRLQTDILTVFHQELGINPVAFKAEMAEIADEHNGYDLFAHVERHGFGRRSAKLMLKDHLHMNGRCRDAKRHSGSYLFPESPTFIAASVQAPDTDLLLLTTGAGPYQSFKLNLESLLDGIHRKIISYSKDKWVIQHVTDDLVLHGTGITGLDGTQFEEVQIYDDRSTVLDGLAGTRVRRFHTNRNHPDNKYPQECKLPGTERLSALVAM